MTGRERLLKTINGEKTDRIPVAPFLYYNNIYEMFDYVPDIDNFYNPDDFDPIKKYIDYCDYFGFDVIHSLGSVWDFYTADSSNDKSVLRAWENWDVNIYDQRNNDEKLRTIIIKTPEGELKCIEKIQKTSKYLVVSEIKEYLIKSSKDFDIFRQYAPPADFMDCSLVRRAQKEVGTKGIVSCCIDGVYNTPGRHFMNYQDFMMLPHIDEGFYREMMNYFLERIILRIKKVAQNGADLFEIAGNLAGSEVGPVYFKDYVLNYEAKLVKSIHDNEALTIYHNCGQASKIMHLYNDLNIDCWGYLTPPPHGDVDIKKALKTIRNDIALRGNIDQVDFLQKAKPKEIKKKVKNLIDKVRPRGNWILSTTDFMFDGTPYKNIKAFAETGLEHGRY